jgi:hypothetical protein
VAAVYTWGEPRVGDSKFRDVFNAAYGDRCFRVRNAGPAMCCKGVKDTRAHSMLSPLDLLRAACPQLPLSVLRVCALGTKPSLNP